MEDQVGRLFEGIDKPIVVFYVGDHDPSGRLIGEDMHRRVQIASGTWFAMHRLAINAEDIAAFNLPPQRIKGTDTRAAQFRADHGDQTVELEALPVAELRRRAEVSIDGLINHELWNRQVHIQEVELASIAQFADTIQNLPQMPPQ